jgi:hypothetical protein
MMHQARRAHYKKKNRPDRNPTRDPKKSGDRRRMYVCYHLKYCALQFDRENGVAEDWRSRCFALYAEKPAEDAVDAARKGWDFWKNSAELDGEILSTQKMLTVHIRWYNALAVVVWVEAVSRAQLCAPMS